jgi:radical SAM superfamily enzyme YgiQ (UPF0313 family)
MPSRVLLISPNRCSVPDPVFPLGLAHLGAALRQAGHQVRWHDALVASPPLEALLSEFQPHLVGISLRNVDNVLLRTQEVYFEELHSLCSRIRRIARCPIVLGGSGFSIFPEVLLRWSGADYGICGAGEEPLVSLIEALESGSDGGAIPGLVFSANGAVRLNPPRWLKPALPLTDDDLPAEVVSYYLKTTGTLNLQTQRGCSFRCCYCTYPLIEGRAHLRRPPEEIADDFAQAARLGARCLFVVDSVFNSSPRHVQETCEAILRRNVRLPWACFLRPQALNADLMNLMARAGLTYVEFGSDSLSDDVLAAYHKGLHFEDIRHAHQLAREAGIDSCHFLICGGPGETAQTLRQNFERSEQLEGAVFMTVVGMRVYPGTPLFERALAEGRFSPDTSLLQPVYYVSPALTAEEITEQLTAFAQRSPNWIVGDPSPAFANMVRRLRERGVVGPLWSYVAMIQRLWPTGFTWATASPAV